MSAEYDRERERLARQWYVDYSREDEYTKNPLWSKDIRTRKADEQSERGRDMIIFFDKFGPQNVFIKSDAVWSLMEMR